MEYFPPSYDPGDIRTQPSYVRSLFDYQWKQGMTIPVREKKESIDPDAHLSEDNERQVYGQDMSQLQLGKVLHVDQQGNNCTFFV